MKKIKSFYEDHKTEIIVLSLTGVAMTGAFVLGRITKTNVDPYLGKSVVSWFPKGKFISVEEAKKVLDLNSMGEGIYALVQEAPNVFTWVVCNDKVIPLPL